MQPSISAFFYASNDELAIEGLIRGAIAELRQVTDDFEVIVVNAGSLDQTAITLKRLSLEFPQLLVIHHPGNVGFGAALLSGFESARKDLIFYTDGDGQYNAKEFPKLFEALKPEVGFVTGYKIRWRGPWYQVAIGEVLGQSLRIMFNLSVRDVGCDFWLFRRRIVEAISLESNSRIICIELLRKLQMIGCQPAEVPISHFARSGFTQFLSVRHLVQGVKDALRMWLKLVLLPCLGQLFARQSKPSIGDERESKTRNETPRRAEMLDETSAQLPANGNRRLPTGLTARRPLIDKLEHPPSPESRNPILRKVVRQIAHMTNLVGQVMPRSTSNVNQLQLRFDKVAVSTVLRDLEFELDPIAAAYGIRMEWQFFCPEAQIWADGGAIRHLILILIDNALKFTDGGGTVSVAVRMQGSYCLLEIGDTGCGIDAADLPHLFDRFYGSNSARPTGRGPGLGLPIARAIVHTHHGTIDVASELGAGTLFRVKLPTVPCE